MKSARRLAADRNHEIKAVMAAHNETSTGVTSNIARVRQAMDAAKHPALLMVDTVSSLGSIDYRHTEWGVDVGVGGSQKGLMLPPGLSFNAISKKAIEASKTSKMPKSFWRWDDMLATNAKGFFPYTPATNLLYGLKEALAMLSEEGLDNVFCRHQRLAEATRRAVRAGAWKSARSIPPNTALPSRRSFCREGFDEVGLPRARAGEVQHVAGGGSGTVGGQSIPHRPPRRASTI